jgi:cytochrome c peroxidase
MKQAFSRFMRTSFRAPQARNLLVSTATIGTAYYVYQQNKRLDLIPLMNLGVKAQCASVAYQKPSQDRVDQCHKDMMDFIGKRRNMAPLMIRLSWHDAGTYDAKDGSGGPRACMRFDGGEAAHGANAGLQIARDLVAPLKEKYQDFSNADFWSLAAICAIKVMGGPDISWRAGRPDSGSGKDSVPDGRLPDATQGCPHLRSVFHRMGFSD